MTIDEAFKKYPENIIGFRVNGHFKIIDVWIPKGWTRNYDYNQFELTEHKLNNDGTLNYCTLTTTNQDKTFLDLFKELERLFEYNINLVKKKELFDEKMKLLLTTFESLDYESLEKLSFVVDKPEPKDQRVPPIDDISLNRSENKTE